MDGYQKRKTLSKTRYSLNLWLQILVGILTYGTYGKGWAWGKLHVNKGPIVG